MSLHNPIGSRKQLMAMVGMTWTINLRRISLHAWDSNFSFHPWIFSQTLSLMKFKLTLFFSPTTTGNPRHFSYSLISGTPINSCMEIFVAANTFLLKKRVSLDLLICCPEDLSYLFKILWMLWISPIWAWQKHKLSFANNRWVIFGPLLQREKPLIYPPGQLAW